MIKLLEALVETECKATLKFFSWSYDALDKDDFVQELLELIGDQGRFSALEQIELRETMEANRNKYRAEFREKGIKLVLSDRQMMSDEESDSEEMSD